MIKLRKSKNKNQTNLGNCPKCNGQIKENGDYWECENINRRCNFKIKNIFEGEKIDNSLLSGILNDPGCISLFEKVKSEADEIKNRKKYLGSNNSYYIGMSCKSCGHSLYSVNNSVVRCSNKNCTSDYKFIPYYKGVTFAQDEFIHMIRKGVSKEYTFNDGSRGRVLFKMDEKKNITPEFLFIKDIRELNHLYLSTYLESIDKIYYIKPHGKKQRFVRRLIESL